MKKYYFSLILLLFLFSCALEEGEGGKASIKGRVIVQEIYSNAILGIKDSVVNQYPAVDEKVFIKYGDNSIYDDDFNTDDQGYYKFEGLTKGDYTLTTYSYCDSCDTEIVTLQKKITLSTHKEDKTIEDFNIQEK